MVRGVLIAVIAMVSLRDCTGCSPPGSRRWAVEPECKANLKAIHAKQRDFRAEYDRYSPRAAEVGFSPERGNRYAYFLSELGTLEDRSAAVAVRRLDDEGIGVDTLKHGARSAVLRTSLPNQFAGGVRLGVVGTSPGCEFVAACAGNIDSDPTLDIWSIASFPRVAADGTTILAGQPWNEVNDVDR